MKKLIVTGMALCLLALSTAVFAFPVKQAPESWQPNPDNILKFGLTFGQIKQFYVHNKKDKELFDGAIKGMLVALDPHSTYLDEETFKEFMSRSRGDFVGVGIEISSEKGTVKVIAPLDDTPAKKAGIKAGDYIIAVDGTPVVDMPINDIVKMIRGKPGTKVTLTVINKKETKPRELTMTRAKINLRSVKSELLDNHFGYLRISSFQEKTGKKAIQAVKKLNREANGKLQGLIIDLRNNPGGLLDSAVEVVDAFVDSNKLGKNKKIVYTEGRVKEAKSQYNAKPGDLLKGKPIIVLINQGSASGSEIVAGALQDHKRAVVLGETSFGKGSVQTLLPLDDKTAIKLTTALYYTPKGRSIQAEGIKPDILVEEMKLAKSDEDVLFFLNLREKHLQGHLEKASKEAQQKVASKKKTDLASKDYQLHEALIVLKALAIANQSAGQAEA